MASNLQVVTRPNWVGEGPGVAPADVVVGGAVGVPGIPMQTKYSTNRVSQSMLGQSVSRCISRKDTHCCRLRDSTSSCEAIIRKTGKSDMSRTYKSARVNV